MQAGVDFAVDGDIQARRGALIDLADSIETRLAHMFARAEDDILTCVFSRDMRIAPYAPALEAWPAAKAAAKGHKAL